MMSYAKKPADIEGLQLIAENDGLTDREAGEIIRACDELRAYRAALEDFEALVIEAEETVDHDAYLQLFPNKDLIEAVKTARARLEELTHDR